MYIDNYTARVRIQEKKKITGDLSYIRKILRLKNVGIFR